MDRPLDQLDEFRVDGACCFLHVRILPPIGTKSSKFITLADFLPTTVPKLRSVDAWLLGRPGRLPTCCDCADLLTSYPKKNAVMEGKLANEIFISYRRSDDPSFAGRLYDHLEAAFPSKVFLDVAGIQPGHSFDIVKLLRVIDAELAKRAT